jgi:hypothetical protein
MAILVGRVDSLGSGLCELGVDGLESPTAELSRQTMHEQVEGYRHMGSRETLHLSGERGVGHWLHESFVVDDDGGRYDGEEGHYDQHQAKSRGKEINK